MDFLLPKKWCLKVTEDNIAFCKELKNQELGFPFNYDYTINSYYSPIKDNFSYKGALTINNRTEITFEQFKKWILKEDNIEIKSKLDKLIRQSKELYNL